MVWNYYFISARWLPPLRINKVKVKVKVNFPKFKIKKPFVVPFLSPKNFDLTLLNCTCEHCRSVQATEHVNGYVIFPEK